MSFNWVDLVLLLIVAGIALSRAGRAFLPEFNEGTLTIGMIAPAGTSLEESDRLATRAERMFLEIPEVTHVSLYDGTVEGFRHTAKPIFSVQYHPEASPGPHDADYLFRQFLEAMEKR